MAYKFDSYDNSLVIDGVEKGIADSPFDGIADMRNVNIISVPGEASVGFSTTSITQPAITGTVTSANAGTDTITYNSIPNITANMAVSFSATTIAGISTNTVYWLGNTGSTTSKLYTDYLLSNLLDLTSGGTGTFTTYTMTQPKHFAYEITTGYYFMVDSSGQVWYSSNGTTFIFTGNTGGTGTAHGNGLVCYTASDGTRFVFVWRDSAIDYLQINLTPTWVYGWNPATGGTGTAAGYLKTGNTVANSHEVMVAPDSRVYYCDANWIGRFYQKDPTIAFVPTTPATYVFDQTALLPTTDKAQCLTFLGTTLLIGGKNNIIYPWDRFSSNFSYPILCAENSITKMVTINTSTYVFIGNRGRIYITNGTNVQFYKKLPDHISGTVDPYFTWGGATYSKNQLYFSASVTTNAGVAISQYGGLWAIDTDTNAMRLVNQLSYGTYAGYATALISNFSTNPAGTGLLIGWFDGVSGYGIDTTSSTPYTNSMATIDSDLIPIGTYNKPRDFTLVEYKLTKPLVSSESIVIKTRLIFNTQDTGYTTTLTDSTTGNYSNTGFINFKNAQWVQFQIVLNSTASSPSYTRFKHLRILGLTGPTLSTSEQLSI